MTSPDESFLFWNQCPLYREGGITVLCARVRTFVWQGVTAGVMAEDFGRIGDVDAGAW